MKSLLSLSLIILLVHGSLKAQNKPVDPCFLLTTLLKQADTFEAEQKYIKSLNKLYSARIAARTCKGGERIKEVDQRIDSVSYEINKQREDAINAKKEAEKERNRALQAERFAENSARLAREAATEALEAKRKADRAAQKADSSARITEASRLTTLALQVKEDDPTLALQLIRKACDTSYFNYNYAVETLHAILSTTSPASYYLKKIEQGTMDFSSVVMADNGRYLIAGSYSDSIRVWNLSQLSESGVGIPAACRAGHKGAVLSLATSADGSLIASGGTDGAVHLWNNMLEKQAISLAGHAGAVLSMAMSADKRYLVSSGEDKVLNVWNLTTGTLEKKLNLPYGNGRQVCFSPDGSYIGIAGNDETVGVWDWQRENGMVLLEGHLGAVRSVGFSADGNYIVSGGDDKTVKVWDWKKHEIIHTLQGHQSAVLSTAFSSDKFYVVSTGQDNTIKVWDLHDNRLHRELRGHQKPVFAAGFYENGRYIYSGSFDRTVKLWEWKQNYMVHPPARLKNRQKGQSAKNNLVDINKNFSQNDTTLFSQYIITQGSDKTIWLWDSISTSRPLFIVYGQDNIDEDTTTLQLSSDTFIIKSTELYQAFFQKLSKMNGKLIPAITAEDQFRFFRTSQ